ncbi:hypothetical protein GCM10027020_27150 [Nocardioides salsibiostraticola]
MSSGPRPNGGFLAGSTGRRTAALFAASALVLTACGSDTSTEERAAAIAQRESPGAIVEPPLSNTSLPTGTTVTDADGAQVEVPQDTSRGGAADNTTGVTMEDFFDPTSPWNTSVEDTSVDRNSDRMIAQSARLPGLGLATPDTGLHINTTSWTTPVVMGGEPTKVICRQLQCGEGEGTLLIPVPDDVDPDPRYDGWYTIVDQSAGVAYDLWRARRENDGSLTYHFMRIWDLDGPGYDATTPPTRASARGSGLPLFAGLIQPGELERGDIDHALAISVPAPARNYFVAPASSTDGNGSAESLPEGARIRLKDVRLPAPIDPTTGKPIPLTRAQVRQADAIHAALRTYGAIVVGRAPAPTLYAQRDVLAGTIDGRELRGLRMEDFEVIALGTRYPDRPEETGVPTDGQDAR